MLFFLVPIDERWTEDEVKELKKKIEKEEESKRERMVKKILNAEKHVIKEKGGNISLYQNWLINIFSIFFLFIITLLHIPKPPSIKKKEETVLLKISDTSKNKNNTTAIPPSERQNVQSVSPPPITTPSLVINGLRKTKILDTPLPPPPPPSASIKSHNADKIINSSLSPLPVIAPAKSHKVNEVVTSSFFNVFDLEDMDVCNTFRCVECFAKDTCTSSIRERSTGVKTYNTIEKTSKLSSTSLTLPTAIQTNVSNIQQSKNELKTLPLEELQKLAAAFDDESNSSQSECLMKEDGTCSGQENHYPGFYGYAHSHSEIFIQPLFTKVFFFLVRV
jgi:hypothetical protein